MLISSTQRLCLLGKSTYYSTALQIEKESVDYPTKYKKSIKNFIFYPPRIQLTIINHVRERDFCLPLKIEGTKRKLTLNIIILPRLSSNGEDNAPVASGASKDYNIGKVRNSVVTFW